MKLDDYITYADFSRPTAVIRVNQFYYDGITPDELYDITRCFWKTACKKVKVCDLVLSVYHGNVKEVYIVDEWVSGESIKLLTNLNKYRSGCYGFNGHVAPKTIRDKFVGRSVARLFKHGDQSPVRVFNVSC